MIKMNMKPSLTPLFKNSLKPLLYLLPVTMSLWPLILIYLIVELNWSENWMSFVPVFLFGITPILDFYWGDDPERRPEVNKGSFLHKYYSLLPVLCTPAFLILVAATPFVLRIEGVSELFFFRYVLSVGLLGGVIAINVAHELIHRPGKFERLCGGLLLSSVSYGGFKVEHIRHHHVHVGTDLDPASSLRGQTLYNFVLNCLFKNPRNAFRAEADRLKRKKKAFWSLSNEVLLWYCLSFGIAVFYYQAAGLTGLVAFVLQSLVAICLLESVNYLEHYGLRRKKSASGRYEKVKPRHSWNSNVYWSSIYLFQLPRHSDHHEVASRPYFELQQHKVAPQLPMSYPCMVLIALIPPVWFRIMNPKLDAYLEKQD